MPLENYGILKARAIKGLTSDQAAALQPNAKPHYQIRAQNPADNNGQAVIDYRVAVNVQSVDQPATLQYSLFDPFTNQQYIDLLNKQAYGATTLDSVAGGLALDYVCNTFVDPNKMEPIPFTHLGPIPTLNKMIDGYVQKAIADSNAFLCVLGTLWGPEYPTQGGYNNNGPDGYFGFEPQRGIDNVHMNQGDEDPAYQQENGDWQDGGLFFFANNQWAALFFKFQTQVPDNNKAC